MRWWSPACWIIVAGALLPACSDPEPAPSVSPEPAEPVPVAPEPAEEEPPPVELTEEELATRELRILAAKKPVPESVAQLTKWLTGETWVHVDFGFDDVPGLGRARATMRGLACPGGRGSRISGSYRLARFWIRSWLNRDRDTFERRFIAAVHAADTDTRRVLLGYLLEPRLGVQTIRWEGRDEWLGSATAEVDLSECGLTRAEVDLLQRGYQVWPDPGIPHEFRDTVLRELAESGVGDEVMALWEEVSVPVDPPRFRPTPTPQELLDRLVEREEAAWDEADRPPSPEEILEWLGRHPWFETPWLDGPAVREMIASDDAAMHRRLLLAMVVNPTLMVGVEDWVRGRASDGAPRTAALAQFLCDRHFVDEP